MIISMQIDTENSKTLTDAVEFIKKLTDKPQKSETTPEFESVADDRTETAQTDDVLETPANMIKFCKTKLCSMAKNGSKDKAKEFMIRHKLKSTADISTLSESRLTEFYHELVRI